jgi:hypothetical protein
VKRGRERQRGGGREKRASPTKIASSSGSEPVKRGRGGREGVDEEEGEEEEEERDLGMGE